MTASQTWPRVWAAVRLLAAVTITVALTTQVVAAIGSARTDGADDDAVATVVTNLLGTFTNVAAGLAVIVLVWAAAWQWSRGSHGGGEPRMLAFALACVTTCQLASGLLANVVLRPAALESGVAWATEVLFVGAPVLFLVDLVIAPRRRALPWGAVGGVLVVPGVWLLCTLIRGPLTTDPATGEPWWYPYPFLDPHVLSADFLLVLAASLGGFAAFAVLAAIVVGVGRLRGGERRDTPTAAGGEAAGDDGDREPAR